MAPLGIPCAVFQSIWSCSCSPLRLPSTQVTPKEGLHGAVPPQWLPLAGDTGRRRVS